MDEDTETGKGHLDAKRRWLETRDPGRLKAILKGPLIQHNYLVRCGENLRKLNPESNQPERLYRIFPTGGLVSRVGDACAFLAWVILIAAPILTIVIGCVFNKTSCIVNSVIVCVMMTSQLVMIYLILKNSKKLKRLWYVSKVESERYLGWKNQVTDVTLDSVKDLDVVSVSKRKEIISQLSGKPDGKAVIMVWTKSFWRIHVLDPVICLTVLAVMELVSLVVQLEMIRRGS